MRYEKGSFITIPNASSLLGLPPVTQCVFMWLCSFADAKGKCFPSRAKLAKIIGVKSVRSVDTHLNNLIEAGFIRKEVRKEGGINLSSMYQIVIKDTEGGSAINARGSASSCTGVVQPLHGGSAKNDILTKPIELNPINYTSEQSSGAVVNEIISLFEVVNPKKLYGSPPQRKATQRLIDTHGVEQLKKVIAILSKTNTMQYMPTITTPVQLEDKWASLEANLRKRKEENIKKQPKVAF